MVAAGTAGRPAGQPMLSCPCRFSAMPRPVQSKVNSPQPPLPACRHVGGAPCGCCYAFGGVAGVEAANALYTGGQLTTLSEQEIVDCDGLDYGCDGGLLREWGGRGGGGGRGLQH